MDAPRVSQMLARAFANDPAMSWIFPDPEVRAKRLPRLFRLLYATDGPHGRRLLTANGEAATLWRAPGQAHTGRLEMLRHAIGMIHALGGNMTRALTVGDAIDAHFPREPFWYLHVVGCDPARQGQGFGGAAIRAGLDRFAGRGPAYLETATESNLALYQRCGFAVIGEWRVPKGGPRFWSMRRVP